VVALVTVTVIDAVAPRAIVVGTTAAVETHAAPGAGVGGGAGLGAGLAVGAVVGDGGVLTEVGAGVRVGATVGAVVGVGAGVAAGAVTEKDVADSRQLYRDAPPVANTPMFTPYAPVAAPDGTCQATEYERC
jgi:hypothetical protein